MSVGYLTPSIGLELIAKAAIIQLSKKLNSNIDLQNAMWADSDISFANQLERNADPIVLEHIPNVHLHYGFRPSILRAPNQEPVSSFPAVCVYPARAVQVASIIDYDQDDAKQYDNIFIVELRHRSIVNEEAINPIVSRTTDAIHKTLMDDQKFGGLIDNLSFRTVDITQVEKISANVSHGETWYWQGSRLEYSVRKASIH